MYKKLCLRLINEKYVKKYESHFKIMKIKKLISCEFKSIMYLEIMTENLIARI